MVRPQGPIHWKSFCICRDFLFPHPDFKSGSSQATDGYFVSDGLFQPDNQFISKVILEPGNQVDVDNGSPVGPEIEIRIKFFLKPIEREVDNVPFSVECDCGGDFVFAHETGYVAGI